jgi:hypothetical protein
MGEGEGSNHAAFFGFPDSGHAYLDAMCLLQISVGISGILDALVAVMDFGNVRFQSWT